MVLYYCGYIEQLSVAEFEALGWLLFRQILRLSP